MRYFSGTNDTSDTSNTANSSNASKTSTSASYIMIFWTFLLIFWMFCLGTDRTDASFTFSHNNLILNSLISISGSHKPPSQWKFHFNLQSHQSLNMIWWTKNLFLIRREKILEELLATEEKYVDDLQSVLTGYRWFFHWIQFSCLLFLASGTEWSPRPL